MMPNEAVSQIVDKIAVPDVTPQAPPIKDERVSSRLEVLIKREQLAMQRERIAKEKEAELESKLLKVQEFESAKGNSKKAMELLGLNYDELTRSVLADGEIPPDVEIKKVRDEFRSYKQSQEEKDKKQAEEQKRQAEGQEAKAIENFKGEISTYLNDNAARYELIVFDNRADEVFDLIDANYNRTIDPNTGAGKVMKIAEAADKVEEYYEKREADKRKLSKLQTIWGAVPKSTLAQAVKQEQREKPQAARTLTNQLSASPERPRTRPVTDEERIQRAIAYARGLRP